MIINFAGKQVAFEYRERYEIERYLVKYKHLLSAITVGRRGFWISTVDISRPVTEYTQLNPSRCEQITFNKYINTQKTLHNSTVFLKT